MTEKEVYEIIADTVLKYVRSTGIKINNIDIIWTNFYGSDETDQFLSTIQITTSKPK